MKKYLVSRSSDDTQVIFSFAYVIVIAIDFICCGPEVFRILFLLYIYLFISYYYYFILSKSVTVVYPKPIIFRLDYSRACVNIY